MNHPLTVVSHGARRAPVTLTGLLPVDFKSFIHTICGNTHQLRPTLHNNVNSSTGWPCASLH